MAKEFILVPKLKYDRLVGQHVEQQLSSTETQNTPNFPKELMGDKEDKNNMLQEGRGFVSKKQTIGRPPGISDGRRKKKNKNIPWLAY